MTVLRLGTCLLLNGYVKKFHADHAFLVAVVLRETVISVRLNRKSTEGVGVAVTASTRILEVLGSRPSRDVGWPE
jgi:hypothetical protein